MSILFEAGFTKASSYTNILELNSDQKQELLPW